VCLTVTEFGGGTFTVDAGAETLARTAIGKRKVGDKVHLERALRLGDRLGGHIVSGHVDAVGKVVRRDSLDKSVLLEFEAPRVVSELLVEKGSIAIDGVSLTVNTVEGHRFTVAIIPYTQEKSHLLDLRVGHEVNLEADILGKYVRRLLHTKDSGIDADFLSRYGFAVEKPHE
jgi:riboflavin synthase